MIRTRLRSPRAPSSSSGSKSSGALYDLFAVIMHRGSAHSGHYFAYIKDSLEEGQWGLGGLGGGAVRQQQQQPELRITDLTQPSMQIPLSAPPLSASLPVLGTDNSSFFGSTVGSLTAGGLPPGLHLPSDLMLDSTDMQPQQQSLMGDAPLWNPLDSLGLGANNPLHQLHLQPQQPQLMPYNNFGNQLSMGPPLYDPLQGPMNFGALVSPTANDFSFNNDNGQSHLLLQQQQYNQQQQQQYFNNGVDPFQQPFQQPFPDMQQQQQVVPLSAAPLAAPPGFNQAPLPPPPGLTQPVQQPQIPSFPVPPMALPSVPMMTDSFLSTQILSAAPSAVSSSMPSTLSSPSPQPQTSSSSSTAVLGLKQMLKIGSDGGNGGMIASPPLPPSNPFASPLPAQQSPPTAPSPIMFMTPSPGVIHVRRNSALGVLVDIVGKGCPHRLQGRSFKVMKTSLRDFNTRCYDLMKKKRGKEARFSENPPFKIVRANTCSVSWARA